MFLYCKKYLKYMILITGGKGFVGSYLYELAKKYDDVLVLDNMSNPSQRSGNIEYLDVDIANSFPYIKDVDVIFHLAADISVINSINRPRHNYYNNIISTLNMLELARKLDTKIVFSSSAAVYAPSNNPVDEDYHKSPISIYGLSKLHSEQLIEMYGKLYGVKYCILRYSNVYGPGARVGVIPTFISKMKMGENVEIYGDPVRDFVHVEDVALITYVAKDYVGTYNLSTGRGVHIRKVFDILKTIIKYDKNPIIKESRVGEIQISILDNSRLLRTFKTKLQEMGWDGFVGIEEGLQMLTDSLTSN